MTERREWWISSPPEDPTIDQECMVSAGKGYYGNEQDIHVVEARLLEEAERKNAELFDRAVTAEGSCETYQKNAEYDEWRVQQLEVRIAELEKERTKITVRGGIAYLWFGGKDGWQVTSFHPKDDQAIGWPRDKEAKMYINYDSYALLEAKLEEAESEYANLCKFTNDLEAKVTELLETIAANKADAGNNSFLEAKLEKCRLALEYMNNNFDDEVACFNKIRQTLAEVFGGRMRDE